MKKLILFLLLAGSVLVFGQEQKLYTVEARGMGTSPDAATRDALSQAIQQAAGAIVDSQTLMKNDEIIQEKILTASNAIVKKYDVIVPVKKNRNGLYEIRIKAKVEQNLLKQKLIEHKIIAGKVEGTQNIWAEVVTGEKNKQDMDAMIENTIGKIDFSRYLHFDVLGVNGTRGSQAKLYMRPDPREKRKITVAAGLVCTFDADRFQQECMPHIKKIFDSLPFERRQEFTVQEEPVILDFVFSPERGRSDDQISRRYTGRRGSQSLRNSRSNSRSGRSQRPSRSARSSASSKQDNGDIIAQSWKAARFSRLEPLVYNRQVGTGFILNVSPRYRPGTQQFVFYGCSSDDPFLDKRLRSLIQETQKQMERISVSVCLLDGTGNEIHRMRMTFNSRRGGIIGIFDSGRIINGIRAVISPEIRNRFGYSPTMIYPLSTVMDVDELKEIKSFKLDVQMGK